MFRENSGFRRNFSFSLILQLYLTHFHVISSVSQLLELLFQVSFLWTVTI